MAAPLHKVLPADLTSSRIFLKAPQIQNVHAVSATTGGEGGKIYCTADEHTGGVTGRGRGKQQYRRVGKHHECRAAGIAAGGGRAIAERPESIVTHPHPGAASAE